MPHLLVNSFDVLRLDDGIIDKKERKEKLPMNLFVLVSEDIWEVKMFHNEFVCISF